MKRQRSVDNRRISQVIECSIKLTTMTHTLQIDKQMRVLQTPLLLSPAPLKLLQLNVEASSPAQKESDVEGKDEEISPEQKRASEQRKIINVLCKCFGKGGQDTISLPIDSIKIFQDVVENRKIADSQVENIVKWITDNPHMDCTLSQFLIMDKFATPAKVKDLINQHGEGALVCGITGGQHTLTARRKILASDPGFFKRVKAFGHLNIKGHLYAFGNLSILQQYFLEKRKQRKAWYSPDSNQRIFKDAKEARAEMIALVPELADMTDEEISIIPTYELAAIDLSLEHNFLQKTHLEETLLQKLVRGRQCAETHAMSEGRSIKEDVDSEFLAGVKKVFLVKDKGTTISYAKLVCMNEEVWQMLVELVGKDDKGEILAKPQAQRKPGSTKKKTKSKGGGEEMEKSKRAGKEGVVSVRQLLKLPSIAMHKKLDVVEALRKIINQEATAADLPKMMDHIKVAFIAL